LQKAEKQKYQTSRITRMLSTLQDTSALGRPITGYTSTGRDKIRYVKLLRTVIIHWSSYNYIKSQFSTEH